MVEQLKEDTVPQDKRTIQDQFVQANEQRDYQIYTRLMDAALEAKARSIFPHFGNVPEGGTIVDAGSGTGALAELAAEEFRGARVYTLDISHELMDTANNNRSLIKLKYGDASKQNFPDNSVDIKYYSTSGHEIESFGGEESMVNAIRTTYQELKPGGRVIIRDFAKPVRTEPVFMQILSEAGLDDPAEASKNGYIDYSLLSSQALFKRFHEEFHGGNAFTYEIVAINGNEYIKTSPEWAHEFYLRKDYTANWRQEINEKYSYWSTVEAKQKLTEAGYVDVLIIEDPNKFILDNRLKGKIALFETDENGELRKINFPSTHMVAVGKKPLYHENIKEVNQQVEMNDVDYKKLKEGIVYDEVNKILTIGNKAFHTSRNIDPINGSKKTVYHLDTCPDTPAQVIKVVRTDALNDHAVFKAMYQSVARQEVLDQNNIPHMKISEADPEGPPYRYLVQEAVPENAVSAAELIRSNKLTENDISQMAGYVNTFELGKRWQIDTNPFNWYRTIKEDGTTEMVYVDGKVYKYDEDWEFKRIGLLQWINPGYVSGMNVRTAGLPKAKDYEEMRGYWNLDTSEVSAWWKKHLHPVLQPA